MSEMVERVAAAIASVETPFIRDNRWRERGYEVGYVDGEVITDDTIIILGSFPTMEEARAFQDRWLPMARARAAIEQMLEPTEAMKLARSVPNILHPDEAALIWKGMIDAALKGPEADRQE